MTSRPYVSRVRRWTWRNGQQHTDGIALCAGPRVVAHLTLSEAYKLANKIVDTAEKLEQEQNS